MLDMNKRKVLLGASALALTVAAATGAVIAQDAGSKRSGADAEIPIALPISDRTLNVSAGFPESALHVNRTADGALSWMMTANEMRQRELYKSKYLSPARKVVAASLGEQGDQSAQYAAGYALSQGAGAPRDDVAAMEWFKRAAASGHHESALRISHMYANGEGVSKNPLEVRRWECRAFVLGSPDAARQLAKGGTPESACEDLSEDLAAFVVSVLGAHEEDPPGQQDGARRSRGDA